MTSPIKPPRAPRWPPPPGNPGTPAYRTAIAAASPETREVWASFYAWRGWELRRTDSRLAWRYVGLSADLMAWGRDPAEVKREAIDWLISEATKRGYQPPPDAGTE